MPSPDSIRPVDAFHRDSASINTDLAQLVAATADLCRKPMRHGVHLLSPAQPELKWPLDCCLRLEARDSGGMRRPHEDLELEIYCSGSDLHITLAWREDDQRPMLWQGSHPVWMTPGGQRCQPPEDGQPLEALARRLRTLLLPL